MTSVALRDRVERILGTPGRSDVVRMNDAIEEVAAEVDQVTRRLAVIDPEWELIAREPLIDVLDDTTTQP